MNTFSTNLHPIYLQLNFSPIVEFNWNSIQFNSNSIQCIWFQLNFLNSIQFDLNSIQDDCNVVHTSNWYRDELMSLISKTFEKISYSMRVFVFFFNVFNLIACYTLHQIIITFWLKFIYIKVISTYHIIDLWTCVI